MSVRKTIIIGGGVGPAAGIILHRLVIENTLTDGSDQGHLDVIHISRSAAVADRTDFLEGRTTENPAFGMAVNFSMAARALGMATEAVGGVACNTFHAPQIFDTFRHLVAANARGISILDMLGETVALVLQIAPGARRVGILSTTGTRVAGIYDAHFSGAGITTVYVPEAEQAELHRCIYDRQWGLKAVSPPTDRARTSVDAFARKLARASPEVIVLACTELPLALPGHSLATESGTSTILLVDPMLALARALVRAADPSALAPLA